MALNANLAPRTPRQTEVETRKAIDILRQLYNQLVLGGVVNTNGQATGLAGLFFSGWGVPSETLGFSGDHYIDWQTLTVYYKD